MQPDSQSKIDKTRNAAAQLVASQRFASLVSVQRELEAQRTSLEGQYRSDPHPALLGRIWGLSLALAALARPISESE